MTKEWMMPAFPTVGLDALLTPANCAPIPTLFLTAIIAVEIAGGLGLLFNVWTGYVAVTLIVFLTFATVTIHARFVRDPVAGTDQIVHMIKNIAIIGGLINFVAS
jgi:uncharacterized membrane protein YphA (DoxX/SURF4 family)